jgi:hypothetical protein
MRFVTNTGTRTSGVTTVVITRDTLTGDGWWSVVRRTVETFARMRTATEATDTETDNKQEPDNEKYQCCESEVVKIHWYISLLTHL